MAILRFRSLVSVAAAALSACGSAQTSSTTTTSATPTASAAPVAEVASEQTSGGMVLEGQMGYLSAAQLQSVLGPAAGALSECYTDRLAEDTFLSGAIELKFRIGADGTPLWVIPTSSTLGDRTIEQCMIQRAMALRFPRPRGGETETTYPLTLDGGDDARPATDWPPSRIEHVATQHHGALERCTHGMVGPFTVTLYAAPHGTVASVGVSVANQGAAAAIDCLVREVRTWHVPDPGSWYARSSVTVR